MLIMLTSRCHMGCSHCMQDATPDGRNMTDETFQQVLNFCRDAKPAVVCVTGGEPTEHPKCAQYAKELLSLPSVSAIAIVTNGEWIDDAQQRIEIARLVREGKKCVCVQVYSHPKYYKRHDWTVAHTQQFQSIGCLPDFKSPIFMQDLGRARQNCKEEVAQSTHVPSCINSHLISIQTGSLQQFLATAAVTGKVCRPLIDLDGGIHMSESWLCPTVAHVSDGVAEAFRKMRNSRPCRKCSLYENFEKLHPAEANLLK